jgi:uncharacterized protein
MPTNAWKGPTMTIALAIFAGAGLGYILERGDFCFHSTLRGLFKQPRQLDLFRAYILSLLIAVPGVFALRSLGLIEPWIPPFAWQANILGGLIFGVGMVVAASCITGLFYKLGHGMLGTLVGLAAWALGDILVYVGPLSGLRAALTASARNVTVDKLLGSASEFVLLGVGLIALFWLARAPKEARTKRGKLWGWLPLGIAVGLMIVLAWPLARFGGSNYPYGTSYVPSGIYLSLVNQGAADAVPWIPIALISLILGAFIAALRAKTLWLRGETAKRYTQLAFGGFLMGIGAAFAGGCNLGHSLVGVPLLSLGSIATTISMALGVFLASQVTRRFSGF